MQRSLGESTPYKFEPRRFFEKLDPGVRQQGIVQLPSLRLGDSFDKTLAVVRKSQKSLLGYATEEAALVVSNAIEPNPRCIVMLVSSERQRSQTLMSGRNILRALE